MKTASEILIRCGYLIPVDENPLKRVRGTPLRVHKDYGVVIQNKLISRIDPWVAIEKDLENGNLKTKEYVDAQDCIVTPGLINGHSHLPMTLFRGLADDLPFDEWLFKNILPLEARLVSPEFVRLGTELACLESLLNGITTTHDMYYFEDSVAEVVEKSGMRGVLGEHVFDLPAPDDKARDGNDFRIAEAVVQKYKSHSRIHPIISPHAPYSCGDKTLEKVLRFSENHGVPIGMHVSETENEVQNSLKEYSLTPLARMAKLGLLDRPFIAAHCVHLTDEEILLASQKRVGVVHNPESNMKLGVGTARVSRMLDANIAVGLGTDSVASNNDYNLFGEMDVGAKLQKLVQKSNTAITASDMLFMATRGGAEALKIGNLTGSIEPGKRADVICIRTTAPHMQPLHDPVAQIVYSAKGSEIESVFVDGVKRVEKRHCLSIDWDELSSKMNFYRSQNNL
jgi:5-methylthioadenosine/S-adenosylhomocysteine deaminase